MKIKYLKTIGFRKFQKVFETDLYDITNITGKNRSGKSNILFAIINIFLGTNLSGDEKACLINKKCDASYGELHFEDNQGYNHILIRCKHRIDNKKNFISLDGKLVTQTELISFYKDKKLFLSILNPIYFLSKKPADQKEMVDKYLSNIKANEIFETLDKTEQDILIKRYYKDKKPFSELTYKEQTEFINCHIFNIFMDIAYDKLDLQDQQILEEIPENIPKFITDLNDIIKKTEQKIDVLNGKIEYAQNIVDEKLPAYKNFEKDIELSLAIQELDSLNINQNIVDKEKQKKTVDSLEKDILNKETEIIELEKRMKDGKKKYLAIKSGSICECPTCGQQIQDESKTKTIENMKESLTSDYNRKNLLDTQKKDLELKLTIERCKYHALEGETTIDKRKRIAVLEENIKQLENERLEIEKFNNEIKLKESNIINAKSDIKKFNTEIISHQKLIDSTKKAKQIAQKLYITYIEGKMTLAKQYLKDVNIKFYSVLKTTGEIKEDFIITYQNKPLSDLSRSETIATSLEFANMFNQISGANFPIFIDDYESCADYDFIKKYAKDTQVFISKVEKGTLLKIANSNNTSEFNIIKQSITGFKTINIHKNNTNAIQKAA